MRKLAHATAVALALALPSGGCALLNAAQFATASITNPVTPARLNAVESAMTVAFAALNGYKKACIKGVADVNCRANIAKIQVYTRKAPALLASARAFVRKKDQVNAITAYNELVALIAQFKSEATAAGVPTGG